MSDPSTDSARVRRQPISPLVPNRHILLTLSDARPGSSSGVSPSGAAQQQLQPSPAHHRSSSASRPQLGVHFDEENIWRQQTPQRVPIRSPSPMPSVASHTQQQEITPPATPIANGPIRETPRAVLLSEQEMSPVREYLFGSSIPARPVSATSHRVDRVERRATTPPPRVVYHPANTFTFNNALIDPNGGNILPWTGADPAPSVSPRTPFAPIPPPTPQPEQSALPMGRTLHRPQKSKEEQAAAAINAFELQQRALQADPLPPKTVEDWNSNFEEDFGDTRIRQRYKMIESQLRSNKSHQWCLTICMVFLFLLIIAIGIILLLHLKWEYWNPEPRDTAAVLAAFLAAVQKDPSLLELNLADAKGTLSPNQIPDGSIAAMKLSDSIIGPGMAWSTTPTTQSNYRATHEATMENSGPNDRHQQNEYYTERGHTRSTLASSLTPSSGRRTLASTSRSGMTLSLNSSVLEFSPSTGAVGIISGSITGPFIASNAIAASHIAPNAIRSTHIVANGVQAGHITPRAIDGTHIALAAIQSEHVSTAAILPTSLHSSVVGRGLSSDSLQGGVGLSVNFDSSVFTSSLDRSIAGLNVTYAATLSAWTLKPAAVQMAHLDTRLQEWIERFNKTGGSTTIIYANSSTGASQELQFAANSFTLNPLTNQLELAAGAVGATHIQARSVMLAALASEVIDTFTRLEQRITTVNQSYDQRMNTIQQNIDARVTLLNTTLVDRLTSLNASIDTRITLLSHSLDDRVSLVNRTLDDRITGVNDRITSVNRTLDERITASMRTLSNQLSTVNQTASSAWQLAFETSTALAAMIYSSTDAVHFLPPTTATNTNGSTNTVTQSTTIIQGLAPNANSTAGATPGTVLVGGGLTLVAGAPITGGTPENVTSVPGTLVLQGYTLVNSTYTSVDVLSITSGVSSSTGSSAAGPIVSINSGSTTIAVQDTFSVTGAGGAAVHINNGEVTIGVSTPANPTTIVVKNTSIDLTSTHVNLNANQTIDLHAPTTTIRADHTLELLSTGGVIQVVGHEVRLNASDSADITAARDVTIGAGSSIALSTDGRLAASAHTINFAATNGTTFSSGTTINMLAETGITLRSNESIGIASGGSMLLHSNTSLAIGANDLSLSSSTLSLRADSGLTLESTKSVSLASGSTGEMALNAGGALTIQSHGAATIDTNQDLFLHSNASVYINAGKNFDVRSNQSSLYSNTSTTIEARNEINLNVDDATIALRTGGVAQIKGNTINLTAPVVAIDGFLQTRESTLRFVPSSTDSGITVAPDGALRIPTLPSLPSLVSFTFSTPAACQSRSLSSVGSIYGSRTAPCHATPRVRLEGATYQTMTINATQCDASASGRTLTIVNAMTDANGVRTGVNASVLLAPSVCTANGGSWFLQPSGGVVTLTCHGVGGDGAPIVSCSASDRSAVSDSNPLVPISRSAVGTIRRSSTGSVTLNSTWGQLNLTILDTLPANSSPPSSFIFYNSFITAATPGLNFAVVQTGAAGSTASIGITYQKVTNGRVYVEVVNSGTFIDSGYIVLSFTMQQLTIA